MPYIPKPPALQPGQLEKIKRLEEEVDFLEKYADDRFYHISQIATQVGFSEGVVASDLSMLWHDGAIRKTIWAGFYCSLANEDEGLTFAEYEKSPAKK